MFKKAKIDENEEEITAKKPTAKQIQDKKKSIFAQVSDISSSESDQEKNKKKNVKNKKNIKVQSDSDEEEEEVVKP